MPPEPPERGAGASAGDERETTEAARQPPHVGAPAIVGADIGGTFTDFVYWNGRAVVFSKLPTTPAPEDALLAGIARLDADRADVTLVHGSTVATNAFLERKGARVVLVTTAGFGDVLEIGRQNRERIYDIRAAKPLPLVPAVCRLEAHERLDASGNALVPLTDAEVERVARAAEALHPEAIAICLLHAYANPAHELRLRDALRALTPFVYCSAEIDPAYREYERSSTTVFNAYVGPLVAGYVERLQARLRCPLRLLGSNGGRQVGGPLRRPASMILSGPAGGVIGARAVARASGEREIITLDMGGTSTDVALIAGEPLASRETLLEGLPLREPMLDIHTIGAGGGSIARFDRGGALVVGPESAGANPGPACYGRGGESFTVTDAHVILGHVPLDAFLGGRMPLDHAAAERAGRAALAGRAHGDPDDHDLVAFAEGVLSVAEAAMERAIRAVSARRGYDPAGFALFCFGGAGGLHAVRLARALGMRGVLIPRAAGVLSALGMALADTVATARESVLRELDARDDAELRARFARLGREASAALLADGHAGESLTLLPALDLRYRGQSYELSIPWADEGAATGAAFHAEHLRRFGYADPTRTVEAVNAQVTVRTINDGFPLPELPEGEAEAPERRVTAYFEGRQYETAVYRMARLMRDQRIAGPAILADDFATVLIPPDTMAQSDRFGTIHVTLAEGTER
ncbi:MAG TPA: hydantoinase/oxoprolinase family protein [Ktedonobacterales bacterium]|nr:hydantoinase/oxoprolinase family protein [Ktedonobacterales bacterium]